MREVDKKELGANIFNSVWGQYGVDVIKYVGGIQDTVKGMNIIPEEFIKNYEGISKGEMLGEMIYGKTLDFFEDWTKKVVDEVLEVMDANGGKFIRL